MWGENQILDFVIYFRTPYGLKMSLKRQRLELQTLLQPDCLSDPGKLQMYL